MSTTNIQPPCSLCGLTADENAALEYQDPAENYSPRIRRLVATNDAPTGEERRDLQETLSEDIRELEVLEAKIADVQRDLVQLLQQRKQKKKRIDDYKAILHPIRYTPDDILREIFAEFSGDTPDHSSLDQKAMPWVLSRVCAQWRAVSLSFPRLWSQIVITGKDLKLDASQNEILSTRALLLGVQLARSGSSPLCVVILSADTIPQGHPIFPILLPSCPRWKFLGFFASMQSFSILAPLAAFPLSLEQLLLFPLGSALSTPQQFSQFAPVFPAMPHLNRLACPIAHVNLWSVPHNQITEFHGCGHTADIPTVLTHLPNLLSCTIHQRLPSPEEQTPPADSALVTHHHLQTFNIFHAIDYPAPWLKDLKLPSLRFLCLRNHRDHLPILQFLERSQCSLQDLTITSELMTEAQCIGIIEKQPSLTRVVFNCPQAPTDTFIERLINRDEPVLVPSLQSLTLVGHTYSAAQISRLKGVRPQLVVSSRE